MSYDWLSFEAKCDGYPPPPRTTVYTVAGTGVDMWTGYPADTARALDDEKFFWQPVNYPAQAFPMNTSVDAGVAELVRLIRLRPGKIVLLGYSQGAIVTSKVWRDHILHGDLNHRLNDVVGAVTWGNPMRAKGKANGNVFAGWPIPAGGGISGPDDLTPAQTPDWWLDFAHGSANSLLGIDPTADIYTDTPVGTPAGDDMTAVYDLVMSQPLAILLQVLKILKNPTPAIIAAVEAVINGALFAFQGTGPHVDYDITPAIQYLAGL